MLDLPPPVECGFPEKFSEWRPQQLIAIENSVDSEKRFIGDGLTTGSGKSLRAIGEAVLTGSRALYLTASKGLQDQISTEFRSIGIADVKGKNAYDCRGYSSFSCEEGQMLRCAHIKAGTCPHTQATTKASKAPIVSSNYHCYITNHMTPRQEGPPWGDFDLLILDEAHEASDILSDVVAMTYSSIEILDILQARWPDETPDDWVRFAKEQLGRLRAETKQLELSFADTQPDQTSARRLIYMKRLLTKLERTAQLCGQADWLIERTEHGVKLEALWSTPYTERYLFRGTKKILLMSAMLTKKTTGLLGVSDEELSFHEYPSPFNPKRSPLYLLPAPQVGFRIKPEQEKEWYEWMDTISLLRADRKGIIHSVSFQRGRQIQQHSKSAQYMLVPEQGNGSTARMVEQFKRSAPPRILVSPSVTTGYDFPDDQCRYQIHCKLPMPDIRSPILNARCKSDTDYQAYLTIMKLIQACGRGTRSATDWCENFLPDGHHQWFFRKNWKLIPLWFQRQITKAAQVPPPMKWAA